MTPVTPPTVAPHDCIFHLVPQDEWKRVRETQVYAPASLVVEGFIHCSTLAQLQPVAERYFAGRADIVALRIDPAALSAPVRYEESEPGQHFPHVYGPLDLQAVVEARRLEVDSHGRVALPEAWRESPSVPGRG